MVPPSLEGEYSRFDIGCQEKKEWNDVIISDGNVAIDARYLYYASVANNAGAHNAVYRGDDITARHADGSLSAQVQAGDFTDIFIGDYITATTTANGSTVTTKWRVADIDYYLNTGDDDHQLTQHHLVLLPDVCLFTAYMNSTNTTEGGYQGSAIWKTYIPMCNTAIKTAFGETHVLSYRQLLSNNMNTTTPSMAGAGWTGSTTEWSWVDATADIMAEPQVFGTKVYSSSSYDIGIKKNQFNLFQHDRSSINIHFPFWLSSVASSASFVYVADNGSANYWIATSVYGVRPHFLYH